ncbi:MAG: DUF2382 domain-containing protein [Acetobacteraceae bacterium]|nr:DUF2382 domain-containing protein [Acetobacteraceae bacterium]
MAEWCASSTPDGSGASGTGAADAVGVAGAATAMPDESNGPAGEAPAAGPGTAGVGAAGEVIPVIEERVRVGKRAVERGTLRVRSHVVEHPVQARVRLREERLRVDRPADAAEEKAFRERVVEVSATGEEAVSRRRRAWSRKSRSARRRPSACRSSTTPLAAPRWWWRAAAVPSRPRPTPLLAAGARRSGRVGLGRIPGAT